MPTPSMASAPFLYQGEPTAYNSGYALRSLTVARPPRQNMEVGAPAHFTFAIATVKRRIPARR